jgi:Secretion system C-terminal sorting domain
MLKHIFLFAGFILSSFLIFKTADVRHAQLKPFIDGATEYDELQAQKEYIKYADPLTGLMPDHIREKEMAFYNQYIKPFQKFTRAEDWQSAGPWNVGGRTRALALDATNENVIIAGAVSGGIWRSADAGTSWKLCSDLGGFLGVTDITQDKRAGKQHIWYACTGEGSGNSASGNGAYYFGDGLFKSLDSGKTWAPMPTTNAGTPNSFANPLQISWRIITHPSTDSDYIFVANYGCIYRSNNGGATWTISRGIFDFTNSAYYTDICVTTTGVLYAAISNDGIAKGFARSDDKGLSWTDITPDSFAIYDRTVMGINPNNENEVYFFTYVGIDSTNIWATKTSNYKGSPEYISLLKYTYIAGNGADSNGSWINLSPNLPNNANVTTGPFDKLNCQGGYDMFVKIQPSTGFVFIGGTNIFRSSDGFTTNNNFMQIGGYKLGTTLPYFKIWDNHHPDNHDLLFYPSSPAKVLSASDGGVRLCNDANATNIVWQSLNNGYLSSQMYTVTLDPTPGSTWLLAGLQDNGNFISNNYKNPQQVWAFPFNGDGAYNYIAPNRDFYVMSIQEGRIAKFTLDNNGLPIGYNRIDPIGPTSEDYTFINPFVVDPNDNNIMYLPAGKKLYRQNQLATLPLLGNWDSISTGWVALTDTIKASNTGNAAQYPAQITAIAVSKSPANVVYIGTSNKDVYRIDNANTGNPSFVKINKSNMQGYVSGIAIDPDDSKKVMVVYSNYNINAVFYSTSGGDTFKLAMGNLRLPANNYSGAAPSIRTCAIVKMNGGARKYFLGTSIGLYSTDTIKAGTTTTKDSTKWLQESPNTIGTNVVVSIDKRESDGTVAIGTHGGGTFISRQFPLSIAPNYTNFSFGKIAAYPNPSSNICNVEIEFSKNTTAHLFICDIFGRKVMSIKNESFGVGLHSFAINTQSLANGQYIIVAQNNMGNRLTQSLQIIH